MPGKSATPETPQKKTSPREGWLRRHADYQRAYKEGKRQSLPLMTYFYALRGANLTQTPAGEPDSSIASVELGSRVGLTAGKVLGNAVERNRIKRRMRAAVQRHRGELTANVDVILHPRRTVLEAEFSAIARDVVKALRAAQSAAERPNVSNVSVVSRVTQPGGLSKAVETAVLRGAADTSNGN